MSQTVMGATTATTATSDTTYFNGPNRIFATNTTISNCSGRCYARARGPIATDTKTATDTIFTTTKTYSRNSCNNHNINSTPFSSLQLND
eukprot:9140688-Ditylum_brightwellii.AAC.1